MKGQIDPIAENGGGNYLPPVTQIQRSQFNWLLVLIACATSLTLATNVFEKSWKPHDSLLYGAAAIIVLLGLLLNVLRLYQVAVLLVFFSHIIVHFFFTILMGNAFVSSMLTLAFLALSFLFLNNQRTLVGYAVLQLLAMNIAIFLGDRSIQHSTFVPMRMTVYSAAYLFLFAACFYIARQRRQYQQHNEELLQSLGQHNARLRKSYNDMKEFAFVVAHDLKGPLQAIGTCAELVNLEMSDAIDGSKVQEHVRMIQDGVQTQNRIINDVLAYSRIDGPECITKSHLRFAAVASNVKDQMKLLYPSSEVSIEGDFELLAAESQLQMLLQNLIENGLKYNENDTPRVHISVLDALEGSVTILVEDNGIGIPEKDLVSVFDMFARLHPHFKAEGTGIGLAHCKKIVEQQLQGTIRVESKIGIGTRFTVTLPVAVSKSVC